jgi:hypothetical protein
MGYRSDVAIKVYGDKEGMLKFKKAYDEAYAELPEVEQGYIDDLMREEDVNGFIDDGFTDSFTFYTQHIKWYDEYPNVKFFMDLLDRVEDFGINAEFVKIGEEDDDIETTHYGENVEYFLFVNRSIGGI